LTKKQKFWQKNKILTKKQKFWQQNWNCDKKLKLRKKIEIVSKN